MKHKTMLTGFIIFTAGILLFMAFIPAIGESATEMADDYDGVDFKDYSAGDRVIVYGTITDIYTGSKSIELDGVLSIDIDGDIPPWFEKGDSVYVKCLVKSPNSPYLHIEYLEAEPQGVHSQDLIELIFGAISIAGLLIAFLGMRD